MSARQGYGLGVAGRLAVGVGLLLVAGWAGLAGAGTVSVSLPSVADTGLNSCYITGNGAHWGSMFIGNMGGTPGVEKYRGVIRFDLSSIPTNAVVSSATLRLAFAPLQTTVATISVHRATTAWTEGAGAWTAGATDGATWQKPDAAQAATWDGGHFVPEPSSSVSGSLQGSASSEVRYSFSNLTADAQLWVNHPAWNHGWFVINNDEVNGTDTTYPAKQIWLREHDRSFDATPYLDIQYEVPPRAEFLSVAPAADTGINSCYQGGNLGDQVLTYLGNMGGSPGIEKYRCLIRFDLSAIPRGATVLSATLRMAFVPAGTATSTILLHRVTSAWTEGAGPFPYGATSGATWNQRDAALVANWTALGGDYVATASGSVSGALLGSAASRVDYPFTALTSDVQIWVSGTQSNYGWIMINGDETTAATQPYPAKSVWLREHAQSFDATPYLDILYQGPQGTTFAIH